MAPKTWYLYILECADTSLYTGITTDLEQRIQAHTSGLGAKYTRGRGPLKLLYMESLENRSQATRRELQIKKLSRAENKQLIENAQVNSHPTNP